MSTLAYIDIEKLLAYSAFYDTSTTIWTIKNRITIEEVKQAVADKRLHPKLHDNSRQYHIERVAWFVVHDSNWPVIIEIKQAPVRVFIRDGNHRLAAAVVRQDPKVLVCIRGGTSKQLKEIFGIEKKAK